jgi:hypothetical protein
VLRTIEKLATDIEDRESPEKGRHTGAQGVSTGSLAGAVFGPEKGRIAAQFGPFFASCRFCDCLWFLPAIGSIVSARWFLPA